MTKQSLKILLFMTLALLGASVSAYAVPDGRGNELFPKENVGIGTMTPVGGLVVMNGNVGIGTWVPENPLVIKTQYGSINYDTNGELTISGVSGNTENALTVNYGGAGNPLAVNRNTLSVDNFSASAGSYTIESGSHTTFLDYRTTNTAPMTFSPNSIEAMRIVDGGNIGIGTVTPVSRLAIAGNIGIGTGANSSYLTTAAPSGGMLVQGNVGIGSLAPGQALDVTGTVRATAFVGDGSGLTGVGASPGGSGSELQYRASGTTLGSVVNSSVDTNGNIGLGTTTPEGTLTIMNGNVGIGTWVPSAPLEVHAVNSPAVSVSGQYYSAEYTTTTTLDWNNGNVQRIQLTNGSQTFTFANPQDGGRYILVLKQPSSGAAGTVTWPATVLWPGGVSPTMTTTNSKTDIVSFIYDGTISKYYGNYSLNF